MRFLADENFPKPALLVLRQAGFDVDAISEGLSGSSDEEVLGVASAAGRTLLTFDKDFGELAIRRGLPAECGVILFRLVPKGPAEASAVALATLRSAAHWAGQIHRGHFGADTYPAIAGEASRCLTRAFSTLGWTAPSPSRLGQGNRPLFSRALRHEPDYGVGK